MDIIEEETDEEIKKRKQAISDYRAEREKLFENMSEEELANYLVKMYEDNEKTASKMNLNTISEDDIK